MRLVWETSNFDLRETVSEMLTSINIGVGSLIAQGITSASRQ
jgi:hypothetical protein